MPFTKDSKELIYEITIKVPKTMCEESMKQKIENFFVKDNMLWMFVYGLKVQLMKGGKR